MKSAADEVVVSKCAPANRRYASPLAAGRRFRRAVQFPRCLPAAVADLVRRNNLRNVAVIFAALLLVGCHESGTWQDDAGNWKRIFRAPKPDDIRIVHSWFWRSPHFTYEYEYYIHIEKNADLQHRLLTTNQMKQLTEDKDIAQARFWSQHKPTWFAPKPAAQYEVWMYSNAPSGEFRLLIDRDTHDLFLSDRQY